MSEPTPEPAEKLPFEAPPLELVVHSAMLSGGKLNMPDGNVMQIVNYATPAMAITTKMDMNGVVSLCKILFENVTEDGKKALIELLTGVEVARPGGIILPS